MTPTTSWRPYLGGLGLVFLAACAGAQPGSDHQQGRVHRFAITVHDGTVQPPAHTETFAVGDTVKIRIVDDHADELHIHPTMIAKPIKAGQPLTVTLHVSQAMTYYVEEHRSAKPLLQLDAH